LKVLRDYTGCGFDCINKALRSGTAVVAALTATGDEQEKSPPCSEP